MAQGERFCSKCGTALEYFYDGVKLGPLHCPFGCLGDVQPADASDGKACPQCGDIVEALVIQVAAPSICMECHMKAQPTPAIPPTDEPTTLPVACGDELTPEDVARMVSAPPMTESAAYRAVTGDRLAEIAARMPEIVRQFREYATIDTDPGDIAYLLDEVERLATKNTELFANQAHNLVTIADLRIAYGNLQTRNRVLEQEREVIDADHLRVTNEMAEVCRKRTAERNALAAKLAGAREALGALRLLSGDSVLLHYVDQALAALEEPGA